MLHTSSYFKGIITLIIVCNTLCFSYAQEDWVNYRALDNSFSVSFPSANVIYESKKIISLDQHLDNEVYYVKACDKHPNSIYMVSKVSYPLNTFHEDSLDFANEVTAQSVASLVASTGGQLIYNSDISGVYLGERLARMTFPDYNANVKARILISNDVLYVLQVYTYHDNSLNEFIDLFLDSFEAYQYRVE